MDYRMQADTKGETSRPTLRIGERHASGFGAREAEIAKAILPIDFCSHRSGRKGGAEFLSADDVFNSGVVKKCNFVKMRH